ncbi:restriction endonuclease subunit S [Eubacterium pyruvativorans]|uniref:restriction endonuclease subunit S n=1 Tax=Eubacterium pyruvativorans TaxID=155865 RepID=UPI0013D10082|nr:restriction endonuclease subunit S [Eubacterium pyruvativorans]
MEKKRTPRLRFRGFTDDWEQRKVTELGNIYIGLVTTMTAHYTNDGILLIRNSDIKDGKFEFDTEPIYLDKEFAKQNKSRMHKVGDVITVHTGDVGTSAVITENENNSIGFATIVTRPNKQVLDSWYLSTFLNTEKHKAWAVQMSTGDGRTNYNLMDYTELIVPVPKLEEQKMIASTMSNLNHLITLHQRQQILEFKWVFSAFSNMLE